MKYVLLLEPKLSDAEQLANQIEYNEDYKVNRVRTMREACNLLTKHPQDLALVPITRNDTLVYSLRMLQPDLPIILVRENSEQKVPQRQARIVSGILTKEMILEALPKLGLVDASDEKMGKLLSQTPPAIPTEDSTVNLDKFSLVVQNAMLNSNLQLVMLTRGDDVVGYHVEGNDSLLVAAARHVYDGWDASSRTVQIQYFDALPGQTGVSEPETLLLMSQSFKSYLLTLGAVPNASIIELRREAEKIMRRMQRQLPVTRMLSPIDLPTIENEDGKEEKKRSKPPTSHTGYLRHSYAIILRAKEPMEPELRIYLRTIMPRIARSFSTVIRHLIVREEYIHIVATCPPHRSSGWLAQNFKKEAEKALYREYDCEIPFWREGHYATESADPLSEHEIGLYLSLSKV